MRNSIKAWWWAFGLLIALPALALALLGLRAIRAERIERLERIRLEQRHVAEQIDAMIADLFKVLEIDQTGPRSFYLDETGLLTFPKDRVYFGERGQRPQPADEFAKWPESVFGVIDRALAAEAQGRLNVAVTMYSEIGSSQPALRDWANFSTARIREGTGAGSSLASASGRNENVRGLTPTGLPVALLASAEIAQLPDDIGSTYIPALLTVLDDLVSGTWWLRDTERRFYVRTIGDLVVRLDPEQALSDDHRIDELSRINAAVRRSPLPRPDEPTRLFTSSGEETYLILWSPVEADLGTWVGAGMPTDELQAWLTPRVESLLRNSAFDVQIRDLDGKTVLGMSSSDDPTWNPIPSREMRAWEFAFSRPDAAGLGLIQPVWFGFIGLLVVVLLSGIAMTAHVVRKEMELSDLQNKLVAAVSHEFKSPITGVRLLIERLESGATVSRAQSEQYYDIIRDELNRLERLVDRLLNTQRAESQDTPLRFEPATVQDLIKDALGLIQPQADARNIRVRYEEDGPIPSVAVEKAALLDVLVNLVENAIKFSNARQEVTICASQDDGSVRIDVIDNGIGIAQEDVDRIFDKFYRSANPDAGHVTGTGLGLAMVKAVVDAHGGTVRVVSSLGEGSTFSIFLPASNR